MDPVDLSQVTLKETGLDVTLADGSVAYFNYYWLRDNCATSFDMETRERVFDIFHEEQGPKPESAMVRDGALEVLWHGDCHRSVYSLDWLAMYSRGEKRHDPAALPRKAWFSDHYPKMARFSQPALKADPQLVARWAEALLVDGVAIVEDMPDTNEGLTETVRLLGHVRPTYWGEYFDVYTHIKPTNLAYTAKALEMHTDVPAEDLAPGVQFLHCRANSVQGGDNLFLDGVAVANEFKRLYPEDFKLLAETEIPFYSEHDDRDVRSRQRVIELDEFGEVSGLTISQHMADVFDLPQTVLDRYYPAFCRFGRMLKDPKFVMRFNIRAGECIVFDNHRIVHGRDAYVATSGERFLRGTYCDRGELRSTYRTLVSQRRFKSAA
ncbi:DUF971 domain-containing protein [Rhodospirillaceae bacterium KN72]|uniref:trimethyllysine dioxygenase n=1 Tax=Pacificispira spongiicola TaxID=2729598 RepID=A0A7Y0E1I6_9PROT|nr:TauD/TfdA family dioxygenase [Pacificispira spongiicola]NMM45476.1 DUF971 domain-containing protein [Pacificispira spongiicola]